MEHYYMVLSCLNFSSIFLNWLMEFSFSPLFLFDFFNS
uniref:Uncharacterized protein n=1 Tax=Rhizophora mucronata TaxID=61149 RepID=A0A2P2QXK8_RHIMU